MKRTEQGNWCHCSCVWWIPGLHFQDPIEMRLVMGVPNVDKARYKLKCIFCDTKNGTLFGQGHSLHSSMTHLLTLLAGACIECSHKNCRNSFHVTCAFATKEVRSFAPHFLLAKISCPHALSTHVRLFALLCAFI